MGEKESIQIRDAILHNGLEIGGYYDSGNVVKNTALKTRDFLFHFA